MMIKRVLGCKTHRYAAQHDVVEEDGPPHGEAEDEDDGRNRDRSESQLS